MSQTILFYHNCLREVRPLMLFVFLFSSTVFAQHNVKTLTQPDYDTYNLKGWPRQIVVVQLYEQGDDVNFQETYCFDSVGNLEEYRKRGFGGERVTRYPLTVEQLSQDRVYRFDYDGDVLELRQYDRRGNLYTSSHCIYADGGNIVMSVEYTYDADSGVVTKRTVSVYDKSERLVSVEQYTSDELLLWTERRKYDRRGNLAQRKQTFYDNDGVSTTTEKRRYTYDAHGNWVRCVYSLNGERMYSVERKITYYGE